jgi:hypothetical protein
VEAKEQYLIKSENSDDNMDKNWDWESVKKNVKISAMASLGFYVLKQHMPWIDEESLKSSHKRKQDKLQWLKNPSQMHRYLNNLKPEATRHFGNKKRKYLKTKINVLGTSSKNKNI